MHPSPSHIPLRKMEEFRADIEQAVLLVDLIWFARSYP